MAKYLRSNKECFSFVFKGVWQEASFHYYKGIPAEHLSGMMASEKDIYLFLDMNLKLTSQVHLSCFRYILWING